MDLQTLLWHAAKSMFGALISPWGLVLVLLLVTSFVVTSPWWLRRGAILGIRFLAIWLTLQVVLVAFQPLTDAWGKLQKLEEFRSNPGAATGAAIMDARERANESAEKNIGKWWERLNKPLIASGEPETAPEAPVMEPEIPTAPPATPAPNPWTAIAAAFWLAVDAWLLVRVRDGIERLSEIRTLHKLREAGSAKATSLTGPDLVQLLRNPDVRNEVRRILEE